jgi:hypothetical protein
MLARQAQVLKTVQPLAATAPVPDLVAHELKLARFTEVGERKYRAQHGLKTIRDALLGEEVHLEEIFVRAALDLNQVR